MQHTPNIMDHHVAIKSRRYFSLHVHLGLLKHLNVELGLFESSTRVSV